MKVCTKCGENKSIELFSKSSRNKSGLRSECKECRKKSYQLDNPNRKRNIKGLGIQKIKINESHETSIFCPKCKSYKSSTEYHKNKSTKSGLSLYCKDCTKIIKLESYDVELKRRNKIQLLYCDNDNENSVKECLWCKKTKHVSEFSLDRNKINGRTSYCKECYNSHKRSDNEKIKRNAYLNNRLKTNPNFKLVKNIRCRLNNFINSKKILKIDSHVSALGCTIEFLKCYIETQFLDDMTWDNWGTIWQLDHIKPLNIFDLTKEEQFKEACHYSNLQPLYIHINLMKKDMIVDEQWYIDRGVFRRCIDN